MGYATEADLINFLWATGLVPNPLTGQFSLLDYAGAIADTIEEFERASGWLPFYSTGLQETRYYDPPGPPQPEQGYLLNLRGGDQMLHLDTGLLSFTSLTIGGVGYAGGPGTQQPQFYLKPYNAPNYNRPWTQIEFVLPVYGAPSAVAITGVFGRVLALPTDVNPAIVKRAAAKLHPQIGLSISGGKTLRKAGDEEEQYTRGQGTQPLQEQAGYWDAEFAKICRPGHYKRITL